MNRDLYSIAATEDAIQLEPPARSWEDLSRLPGRQSFDPLHSRSVGLSDDSTLPSCYDPALVLRRPSSFFIS